MGAKGEDGSDLEPVPLVPDVIDPEALWACTTCGACVEECPVDIEHVDAILDMRRYQVLMESSFPTEAGTMLRNVENQGNPWGLRADMRLEWTEGIDFDIPVVSDVIPDDIEWLYWVGCAGGLDDRARKSTQAIARVMHAAGVKFAILGAAETCTGDPARRIGNEYLWQEMAKANIEVLDGVGAKKIIASCPHCFNTIGNEYPALGGNYEVVHHSQLLGRLVAEGKLAPQDPIVAKLTYHDPCYLGRHNNEYEAPRTVLDSVPGLGAGRDAPARQARILLWGRRCADVDGGADRQAGQRRTHRRGARHRRGHHRNILPVLPDHARRCGQCAAGRGRGARRSGHRHRAGARRLDRPAPGYGGVGARGRRATPEEAARRAVIDGVSRDRRGGS